jgi:hypothetical protein
MLSYQSCPICGSVIDNYYFVNYILVDTLINQAGKRFRQDISAVVTADDHADTSRLRPRFTPQAKRNLSVG